MSRRTGQGKMHSLMQREFNCEFPAVTSFAGIKPRNTHPGYLVCLRVPPSRPVFEIVQVLGQLGLGDYSLISAAASIIRQNNADSLSFLALV